MTAHVNRQGRSELSSSSAAPLLLMGHPQGRSRLAAIADGHRLVEVDARDAAAMIERLDHQAAAQIVWIELDRDDDALDALATRLNRDAVEGRYAAVIAAPAGLLDPLAARLTDAGAQLLIDPTDLDRAAALAIAATGLNRERGFQDATAEPSSARLRQISDEVSRIAATLARLSAGPAALATEKPVAAAAAAPISGETVRGVIRARRLRGRYFDDELFADPAWDMMLDLLAAEIAQHRVPVSSLCIAAAVPATTALRWIKTMTDSGLFTRRADPHDGRRVFVELSSKASTALRNYFAEIGKVATV